MSPISQYTEQVIARERFNSHYVTVIWPDIKWHLSIDRLEYEITEANWGLSKTRSITGKIWCWPRDSKLTEAEPFDIEIYKDGQRVQTVEQVAIVDVSKDMTYPCCFVAKSIRYEPVDGKDWRVSSHTGTLWQEIKKNSND